MEIAQSSVFRVAKERIIIESDLRVERIKLPFFGEQKGIDLNQ